MAADFTQLESEVSRNKSVDESAAALINGFQTRLDEAIAANDAGDNSKLTALSADLRASSDSLAAAVSANTPASDGGGEGGGTTDGVITGDAAGGTGSGGSEGGGGSR